jgi:hypothetical protein
MNRLILAAVTAAFVAAPLAAQSANPLVGSWNIEWELGRRMENGEATVVSAKGTLTIKPSGDTLVATLEATSRSDNAPLPKPYVLGGRTTTGGAAFTQHQQVRMNMNGEESTRDVLVTWTLRADGDALSGTMVRDMPGMSMAIPPGQVTGTRAK